MSMENSKFMGEIGALLMIVCPLAGSFAIILGLAGLILVVVAFDGLANHYGQRGIFNNALHGGIAFAVGAAVAIVVVAVAVIGMLSVLGIPASGWFDPSAWQAMDWQGFTNWGALAPYIVVMIGGLIAFYALTVFAAVLMRRSLDMLAQRSGTAMFATSGIFLLVGAVLMIVGVGLILIWLSLVLLAVAFFRLHAEPSRSPPAASV